MVSHTFTPVLRDQNIIFQTDSTKVLVRLDLVIHQELLVQSLFSPLVDPRGNCTEVAYRDENDRPCLLKDGYAKLSFQYDDRGNVVKQVYFGTDDKPCINTGGFTAISQKYNEKGMITEVAFWDIAEKPCLVNGYFMEKTEFDD